MSHRMHVRFLCSPNSIPPDTNAAPPIPLSPAPSTTASAESSLSRSPTPKLPAVNPARRHLDAKATKSSTSIITTSNLVQNAQGSSRIHACKHCSVVFSRKIRFLHHLLVAHSIQVFDGRTILPCASCPSAFLRNTDRSKHMQCVHRRLRPFPCPLPDCNSSFFFAKDLSKHTSTVHLRHRPFRCEVCGRSFGKREHMTSHVRRVHDRLRPFKCQTCNIVLASKYNLEGHFNTVSHRAAMRMANLNGPSK